MQAPAIVMPESQWHNVKRMRESDFEHPEQTSAMSLFSSRPGILGFLICLVAGFLMYASNPTATVAVIGVIGAGVLLSIANRHWVVEVLSLIPASVAGALCGLTTIVWKRDPTAHNLWPFELVMVSVLMTGLLSLSGGVGALVRRYVLHRSVEPGPPLSMSAWIVPLATIASTVGYILMRGAMLDAK
jgi:hypothetical protein